MFGQKLDNIQKKENRGVQKVFEQECRYMHDDIGLRSSRTLYVMTTSFFTWRSSGPGCSKRR